MDFSQTIRPAVLAAWLCAASVPAAPIMMRIGADSNILNQYLNAANYPVCKSGMDYICFDQTLSSDKLRIFDADEAFFVVGTYGPTTEFNAGNTVNRIRDYEAVNRDVVGIWMYRENWIDPNGLGGPFPADRRILSQREIDDHRSAIANANPPLQCKDTVKLVQLLGGRTFDQDGDSWLRMTDEMKEYIAQFDGVGTECHIGDWDPDGIVDGQRTLQAMADMSKWAQDRGKIAFVFMGGGPETYEDLVSAQKTYHYLWAEMMKKGVDYKSDHITYFRQGARDGNQTPESATNTLCHQQKWVVETAGTPDPAIRVIANQTVAKNSSTGAIPFTLGSEFITAFAQPVITIDSSNATLLPNAHITLGGSGANRTISLTPVANQTGTTTISITATIAPFSYTQTFELTVAEPTLHTAAASGAVNTAATWGGVLPVAGDRNVWQSGARALSMASGVETFQGGELVLQSGGSFIPGIATATLTLNDLTLAGGEITTANNNGLTLDLRGHALTLGSGMVRAGGVNNGRDIRFKNGSLTGSGTIQITGTSTNGSDVELQSTIDTRDFAGTFDVSNNGILNLSPIADASFGLALSGTGKYANDAAVAVTSLTIAGTPIAAGTYTYADFPAYFLNNGGTLIVAPNTPPTISAVADLAVNEDVATSAIPFTIGDDLVAANNLLVESFSSDTTLVSDTGITLGGSGASRTVIVQPATNQYGSATITLRVSDGVYSTNELFVLTVNPMNDAPVIAPVENHLSDGTGPALIPFTVSDNETAAALITVTKASSNAALVPAANIVIAGSGADRTATITPISGVTGTTVITLTANDGSLNGSRTFVYAVDTDGVVSAVQTGSILAGTTWATGMTPLKGDTRIWQTGALKITVSPTKTALFHGHTLEVQSGGRLDGGIASAILLANNLTLSGGLIYMNNTGDFGIDLSGHTFTLNSGTIQTGTDKGRDVTFAQGVLAGNGIINITGTSTNGSNVEFEKGTSTHGFTGTFNVHSYGVLNLPPATGSASFGIELSGTGKYWNDASIAVRSLVIDGTSFGPGTYTYNSFTSAKKAFLFDNGGTITVAAPTILPPTIGSVADQTTREGTPTPAIPFTVSGGANVNVLQVSGFALNPTLVPNENFQFGGSGSNRTVVITPVPGQTGTAGIRLVVSDGILSATNLFSLTVTPPPRTITAIANGNLSSSATWGEAAPLSGDGNTWQSGSYTLDMKDAATQTFNGDTLVLQSGGLLAPGIPGATLSLNHLVLDGGTVYMGNNLGVNFDLRNHSFTLNSGTLQAGSGNRGVRFLNGSLKGTGTIKITGKAVDGGKVTFQDTITTADFSGLFNVSDFGILDLPPVPTASFGMVISGSGKCWNDTAITVTTLKIAGHSFLAGTYTYATIGATYQPYLADNGGTITVTQSPDPYTQWAESNAVTGGKTDDDDSDGLLNLAEYALGGNPANPAERGHAPTIGLGTNWLDYVHVKRSAPDSAVSYSVEIADDLVSPAWTTNGVMVVGTGVLDAEFSTVTNRISTEIKTNQFIRLMVE